jgi:hypothetical protein
MSVLKLSKNDITRDGEENKKIKLKKSDIIYAPNLPTVDSSSGDDSFGTAPSEEGTKGWQKYLDDIETEKQAEKEKPWWEKLLGYLGDTQDTTLPMATTTQVVKDLKNDTSSKKPHDDWSEEQKYTFGSLYLSDPTKAFAYAEETNKKNNEAKEETALKMIADSATSNFGAGLGHTIGAIASAPLGMADFLNNLAMANAGRDIAPDGQVSPFEYSQTVTGGISTHLNEKGGTINEDIPIIGGKGWGDVYGLGTSIAQSMASAYTLGGAGTLVSYFGQGAAAGMDDALSRGASEGQAALYGTALGVFEGVAESIGIDNLFKLGSSTTIKGFIKNILKQAGAEGAEEGLTSVLGNIADAWVMQDKSNFNIALQNYMSEGMSESDAKWRVFWDSLEGIAFDTIAGAASGGISGGIHTTAQTVSANNQASKLHGNGADITAKALEIDANNAYAQKMQAKLDKGKSLSGGQINRLIETNEQALKAQDTSKMKSAAEARLTQLGENGDVSALAEVLVKQASGEKLSRSEQAILKASKYGQRVSNEMSPDNIKSGGYTSTWAENLGTETINREAYNKELYALASEKAGTVPSSASEASAQGSKTVSTTKNPSAKENATEGKFEVSESGKTTQISTGEEVGIAEIASVNDGGIMLRLNNGNVVSATDVNFGTSDEGLLYENVVDMGVNAATANAFIKGFDPSEGMSAKEYALGFREAYKYGEYGFPVQEMSQDGFSARLSQSQKDLAYNLGKTDSKYKVSERQKTIEDSSAARSKKEQVRKGRVHYEGSLMAKNLTSRQKASLKGLETLSDALGVDFYIFESAVDENGKRKGANGWFDPKDGSIHIDLFAGQSGEGTMLFTAAHELTHFIRKWSPAKFKIFADFLLEQYGKKGVSVEELVQRQIEKAESNGRDIDYDTAYEEVIADSCEMMLADGDAIAKIAELKAKDKSLWEKIKDFITDLVAKIKKVYEGLSPDSVEGSYVAEMLDSAEKLKALWTDALADAGTAYSTIDKNLMENGIAVDSKTESASLMSVRYLLDSNQHQKVAEELAERFGVTVQEAKGWIDAEMSLASIILNPKYSQFLDYTADKNEEAIKSNSDYPQGTVDFSNICKKRRDFTEVMNRLLRNFPHHVFEATDLAKIRTIMSEEGMEVACGICYVEDRRQLDSIVAQDFIDSLSLYRNGSKTRPDSKPFNANQLKAFKLIEGDSYTPSIYELISLEGRNSLKAKNPAMEEAWVKFNNARGMQSVRLLLNDAEYKRQILKYSPSVVKRKNDLGGLRIYSFSDMEMFHLIDIIQVITDSAAVGLSIQGYTKVNEYARAVKDTGEKLNRSLIPKGDLGYHMEDGKVVLDYDTVEGIDINHPDFFDNIDNPNVGNIVIGINATQIKAAMTSKFVDQIIPFHTGQSNEVLGEKGIATWVNYKDSQSERDVKTGKKSAHQINIYTEVINAAEAEGHPITNKVEFVNKFLEVCKMNGLIPRFSEFLNVDENGDFVYTEGYHKFLVDFKTFDQNTGEYLPQKPVKPIFDSEYLTKLLKDYAKSQKVKDAKFAENMPKVLDRITTEIVKSDGVKLSDRDSEGNTLSKDQQEFFKDSKVRDKDGNLLVLYHGSPNQFTTFRQGVADGWGRGIYFTDNRAEAKTYGNNIIKAYLNITNPFNADTMSYDEIGAENTKAYRDFDMVKWQNWWYAEYDTYEEYKADGMSVDLYEIYTEEVEVFNKILRELGYDGIIATGSNNIDGLEIVAFREDQPKLTTNKTPTASKDIRYSNRYSYEALTSKPDMKLTTVGGTVPANRADVVSQAKKNAASVGKANKDGSVSVHVKDIDTDVVLSTKGLKHSLDRRFDVNAPITLEAGKILQNSIRINELIPQKAEAEKSYILIGAATDNNGELYVVRSVVNRFSNELTSMDVLYAINAKKGNQLRSMRPWFQHHVTDSTISIAQLLDFVNRFFPDILPESVLRHYGHDARPDGELGKDVLYSDRDSYAPTFYSQMGKVIDGIKLEKIGANSLVPFLKGKGVKNEEIKWSGIETWLEGKKSVTKAELQGFIAGSQLTIEEEMSDSVGLKIIQEGEDYIVKDNDGNIVDTWFKTHDPEDTNLVGWISEEEGQIASDINEIREYVSDWYEEGGTRWSQYRLDGGTNYRELVFKMPNSSYSNSAMKAHWGQDAEGVLAHARIQDMETLDGKKMLFVEEIQSDWHNEGARKGYIDESKRLTVNNTELRHKDGWYSLYHNGKDMHQGISEKFLAQRFSNGIPTEEQIHEGLVERYNEVAVERKNGEELVTDAPFRTNYHEYVLKRLLRMAAKDGYDSLGWTTADTQSERWSDEYAEGYRIEYDQDIPSFLKKYGKKWGATVGKAAIAKEAVEGRERILKETELENVKRDIESAKRELARHYDSYEKALIQRSIDSMKKTVATLEKELSASLSVWSMDIPDSMKNSVLYEGQAMFSDRSPGSVSTRSLLANALETTVQNDIERNKLEQYKSKIDLIESEYAKLTEIRAEIKELSFAKGKRDTARIKALQFEANQAANRINTYDRQLLNLESTTALKNVLNREKELARRKEAQKGKDALAKYKEKAAKTQRELMDRNTESRKKAIEGRNKTEMRHKIRDIVADLNNLLLNPTKDKHVPIGLQKPVASALAVINMDTVGADERIAKYNALIAKSNNPDEIARLKKSRDNIEYQGENLKDKLTTLQNAYAALLKSDDPLIRNAHNEAIENLIENTVQKVGDTSLRNMSLEQLEAVYDMFKAIKATVRNANKMFKEGKQETITDNSEWVKREVSAAGGHRDRVLKATKWLKKFGWNMLKPIYAMKLIGSDTLTRLYENVRKGEDTWAVDVNEAKDFFKETASKYEYNTWDFKKQYRFSDSAGHSFSLSLEQIMSLYAYSKRKQADKHLELGGFIFDDSIEVTKKTKLGIPMKYEVNDANPYRLKKEDLGKVISLLDTDLKNVKGFVDEMQAYLSDVMGAKGNKVSLAMYDIKLYKEQNYFPLKTARYFREFDPEKNGTPKIKNSGFSKNTVPQAGNPIILSNFMDVWANHVNDMSMYHAFVLPLEDFMRVYNYSSTMGGYDSVQQYIKNAYGTQANTYIETLMNDLNGGARSDPATDLIGKGMLLFKKAAVFASASVVIQQPSAIARAMAYIDAKYFVDKPEATKHKETWAEVKKYAPVAIIKEMGYFDTNMGRSTVDWIKEEKTWRDKVDDIASKAPALADELAWCAIWKAVKREVADSTNLKVGSEEFLEKAGKRFTEVVTKTQVYDSVLSRSALMRSKDSGAKMVTAFMAEPTTSLNMVVDAIIEGKRGDKKFARQAVGAVATSIILNSILVSLVTAARDDDEDETYAEKYLESLTAELLDGFNPLTYIPLVKDVWSIAQGYDIERSDMSVWSDLWQSVENLFSDSKSGFEKTEGIVGSIASIFGLPLKNLMRDARAIYNLASTLLSGTPTTWAGVGEAVGGAVEESIPLYSRFVGNDSKSDKLYDAIISGDQKHIDRVKGQYKDDKAIESAIKQGLRENDPRIKKAVQAVINGNQSERIRIQKEIIAEKNFKQDIIVEATNAEISYVRTKINEARKAKKNGDDEEFNKIVDTLIDRGYPKDFIMKALK